MVLEMTLGVATVLSAKSNMEDITKDVIAINKTIEDTLTALQGESSGSFVDSLKTAGESLIQFAHALVEIFTKAIQVVATIVDTFSVHDEEGSKLLLSAGI